MGWSTGACLIDKTPDSSTDYNFSITSHYFFQHLFPEDALIVPVLNAENLTTGGTVSKGPRAHVIGRDGHILLDLVVG